MNRFITILLLISFTLLQWQDVTPYLVYQLNKGYIAEVLCINKNRPELKCNGKCHLKQMLKKQASKQDQPSDPTQNTERITINWLIQSSPSFSFDNLPFHKTLTRPNFLKEDQCFIFDIFHPPIKG